MERDRPIIQFQLIESGCAPTKAYAGDAGWDLYVSEDTVLSPLQAVDVPCGFNIALPDGFWGRIVARSSTNRKHSIIISDAVIDPGYRGPMFVCMMSVGNKPYTVRKGWRLAQLIVHKIESVSWEEVSVLGESARGGKAFGSSGL